MIIDESSFPLRSDQITRCLKDMIVTKSRFPRLKTVRHRPSLFSIEHLKLEGTIMG